MVSRNKLVVYHPVHGYPIHPEQDLKTIKRNARERNRVETVNKSFETLRQHVPTAVQYKKMSKVNIVHYALDYINQLLYMLNTPQPSPNPGYSPDIYRQFAMHQHLHASPNSDMHSPNSFSHSPPYSLLSHSPSPGIHQTSNMLSSTQLWRHQKQLCSPAVSCDSAYIQDSVCLNQRCVISKPIHGDQYLHNQDSHQIRQDKDIHMLNLSEEYCFYEAKDFNSKKICEPVQPILHNLEEDDVLDAIVAWQSM